MSLSFRSEHFAKEGFANKSLTCEAVNTPRKTQVTVCDPYFSWVIQHLPQKHHAGEFISFFLLTGYIMFSEFQLTPEFCLALLLKFISVGHLEHKHIVLL